MKKLFICFLYFLLSDFSFANMSEDEARSFIESLAKPSTEKRVFYRWQSEISRDNLLKSGKMTPRLHKHFMSHTGVADGGLYVSEDIVSSNYFGDSIIKVELEPGYKYLDLTDEEINTKIKSKGLSITDVYNLKPRVAVKYDSDKPHWVLKDQTGVKFKSFSFKGIKTRDLSHVYMAKKDQLLRTSIKHEISKRLYKLYEKKLPDHKLEDMLQLRIKGDSDLGVFLSKTVKDPREKESILDRSISLIKTSTDGESLLEHIESTEQRKRILNKVIPLIKTARGGANLLAYTMNDKERELIFNKSFSVIKSFGDGSYLLNRIEDPVKRESVLNKSLSLMKKSDELRFLLQDIIDSKERDRILTKSLSLMKKSDELRFLLQYITDPKERDRILTKSLSLMKKSDELRFLLQYITDPKERDRILTKGLSLMKKSDELRFLLQYITDPKERDRILTKGLSLMKKSDELSFLLHNITDLREKESILDRSISLIKTKAEATSFFRQLDIIGLDTELKRRVAIKILDLKLGLAPKSLKADLSKEEYKEILAEFKKRRSLSNKIKKSERLQCLKQQMLKLLNN